MPQDDADQDLATPAQSPLGFGLSDLRQVARRIWLLWGFHNLSLMAGGVAFFCFLAITPLIASIVLVYGLVADVGTVAQQVEILTRVIPRDAASVLEAQLTQVVTTSSTVTGIGLIIALALSIYGGMYAANGLIAALIAVAAVTAMSSLGSTIGNTFNNVSECMEGSADCPS